MGLEKGMLSYRSTKDGKVFISWNGKVVMTLKGAKASEEEALSHIRAYLDEAGQPNDD